MGKKAAIIGATGAVGQELLKILDERNFPLDSLNLLASKRSAGKKLKFKNEDLEIQELTHDSFEGIDIVFSSAGGSVSKEFVPSAVKAGAVVVDNTSYFRMDDNTPLVVPEVNPEDIQEHRGIIANPNCSTIIMVVPFFPIYKEFGVKRLVVSTYQAASGAGALAMEELKNETRAVLNNEKFERKIFPNQYAFNLFPHNGGVPDESGYVEEEVKMIKETRKMFHNNNIMVSPTCVRVPILRAHSESINMELEKNATVDEIYSILEKAEGVTVLEDPKSNRWPMPSDASGQDDVFVGRVRKDVSQENTFEMWVVGDQIRKGAALNAVQIGEKLE